MAFYRGQALCVACTPAWKRASAPDAKHTAPCLTCLLSLECLDSVCTAAGCPAAVLNGCVTKARAPRWLGLQQSLSPPAPGAARRSCSAARCCARRRWRRPGTCPAAACPTATPTSPSSPTTGTPRCCRCTCRSACGRDDLHGKRRRPRFCRTWQPTGAVCICLDHALPMTRVPWWRRYK